MTIHEYMTGLEKSVNSLLEENEQLKQQVAERPPESPAIEKLVRLLGEMEIVWGPRMDTLPRGEVRMIELYRELMKEREGENG